MTIRSFLMFFGQLLLLVEHPVPQPLAVNLSVVRALLNSSIRV